MFDELVAALLSELAVEVDPGSVVARALHRWLREGLRVWSCGLDTIVDVVLEQLDEAVATQVEAILHHPLFQTMEGTWRGLAFVVSRVDKRENIKCEILNCHKDDLLADFEDAPEVPKSGLYKDVYSAEYGPFGGRPYGAIFANYDFGPLPTDMALLHHCGQVANMASLPFVTGALPTCLAGVRSLDELAKAGIDNRGLQHAKWHSLRGSRVGASVVLMLGRSLARPPYGVGTTAIFGRRGEAVRSDADLVWQHSSFLVAALVARSFATYRLGCHVVGEISGRLDGLPLHGGRTLESRLPSALVEAAATSGLAAFEAADTAGSVVLRRAPVWMSADAPELAWLDPASVAANCSLSGLMVVTRFVQACKVLQREQIGTWKERADVENELSAWLQEYVAPPRRARSEADTTIEAQLLARVWAAPADPEPKLVYADWLEARGDVHEAEYVRDILSPSGSQESLDERRRTLDAGWLDRWQQGIRGTRGVLSAVSVALEERVPMYWNASLTLTLQRETGTPITLVAENKFDRE
ncbi:MAG: type VI secretion system contractile sheath large subunit [Polyangiaceae bacterium]